MSYPITHVVVQNTPPPNHVVTIGHIYPITGQPPEEIFRTVRVEEDEEDETETKVVRRRGRRPSKANEDAETK